LQFRFPLVQNSAFNRAYREASAAIDAGAVINICIFGAFGIGFTFSPVDALYWTYRNTVSNSFA
jgi:hypothetical protein